MGNREYLQFPSSSIYSITWSKSCGCSIPLGISLSASSKHSERQGKNIKGSKYLGLYIAIHISLCYRKCKTRNVLFIQKLKANKFIYVTETTLHNFFFKKKTPPHNCSFEGIKEHFLEFQRPLCLAAKLCPREPYYVSLFSSQV